MSLLQSASARIWLLMGSGLVAGNPGTIDVVTTTGGLRVAFSEPRRSHLWSEPTRRRFLLYSSDSWAPKDAGDARKKFGALAVPAKA